MSNQGLTGKRKYHQAIRKILISLHHRDQFVTINWGNIREGTEGNFQKKNPNSVLTHGNYDYGSVMHYSRCGFSWNGFETISPTVGLYYQIFSASIYYIIPISESISHHWPEKWHEPDWRQQTYELLSVLKPCFWFSGVCVYLWCGVRLKHISHLRNSRALLVS